MNGSQADRQLLLFILDMIADVERYTADDTAETFSEKDETLFACIKKMEMIGEGMIKLTIRLKKAHKEIPWHLWIEARNTLVHEYFGSDDMLLWQIINNDLPKLREQVEHVLNDMQE